MRVASWKWKIAAAILVAGGGLPFVVAPSSAQQRSKIDMAIAAPISALVIRSAADVCVPLTTTTGTAEFVRICRQTVNPSTTRYRQLKRWYREYRAAHDGRKPTRYRGREKWAPLPPEFGG